MSALSDLQHHLDQFWQLPYHQDSALASKLSEVQTWQRHRINRTHAQLFAQPKNQKMAHYFIHRLYGGDEFHLLAQQLQRIIPKAQKIERLAPTSALETGSAGIHAAIVAIQLDLHLAQWLHTQNLPVTEANMLSAYRRVDEEPERRAQIDTLKDICYRTDKYLKSFMLQKAFALAKSTAYKHDYQPLYDFIAEGFAAMQPLDSVASFIEPFCEREYAIIDHVHHVTPHSDTHDKVDPFVVS